MLKKVKLPILDENEDIEKFYNSDNNEQNKVPWGFVTEEEVSYYQNDINFMRHHKRT